MSASIRNGYGLMLAAAALVRPLDAQSVSAPVTGMRHEVTADAAAFSARRLQVLTSFDVADNGVVLLSLPAWTPGAYEISDFAKWVSDFGARQDGAELRWDKVDPDTWRVRPARGGRVTVSFAFKADSLDNAMSWTRPDFALFNGTNLFMYPEGRSLDFPSTVVVKTDPAFRIATGMTPASAARTYTASSFHELVDMPFFVGLFDLDSARVSGKTFRYATYPVGSVSGAARAEAWEQIKRIVPAQVNVFGEVPWDAYVLLQITDSTYGGYAGLEHGNSHVNIVAPGFTGSEFQPSLYAHEIFHAWNVKRLRPADLYPYQYDRRQPTTWLWMSEGITDYYADIAEVRGGVVDAAGFYALTSGKIGEIAATIPFALEDASLSTWIHPTDGTGYSYYPKGSLAGFLLDITIRDASDNKRSLDTVMRELYHATYKKGRGFTHEDFWGTVRRAAGGNARRLEDFERLYVDGRQPYPWGAALAKVGLVLAPDSIPRIGVTTGADPAGAIRVIDVELGTSAAAAGVQPGDEFVSVGDIPIADQDFGAKFRLHYAGRPTGSPLPMVVKRGTETITLAGKLAYHSAAPRIVEDSAASPRAVRLRNGILRGLTDNR